MPRGRSGITLVLNSKVDGVGRNSVTIVNNQSSVKEEIPFGACVWATGVAMHPLIKQACTRPGTLRLWHRHQLSLLVYNCWLQREAHVQETVVAPCLRVASARGKQCSRPNPYHQG